MNDDYYITIPPTGVNLPTKVGKIYLQKDRVALLNSWLVEIVDGIPLPSLTPSLIIKKATKLDMLFFSHLMEEDD